MSNHIITKPGIRVLVAWQFSALERDLFSQHSDTFDALCDRFPEAVRTTPIRLITGMGVYGKAEDGSPCLLAANWDSSD